MPSERSADQAITPKLAWQSMELIGDIGGTRFRLDQPSVLRVER